MGPGNALGRGSYDLQLSRDYYEAIATSPSNPWSVMDSKTIATMRLLLGILLELLGILLGIVLGSTRIYLGYTRISPGVTRDH